MAFSFIPQLWRILKFNCFKKGIQHALQLSPRQLHLSYAFSRVINRFKASGDVCPFNLSDPPRTKMIEENIDTVRNLVEEKLNFSIFNPPNPLPELVNIVERYAGSLNENQIITAFNDILSF